MTNISRRNLLYAFGVMYATPLIGAQTPSRRAAIAKPGESRFPFASQQLAQTASCKLTNEDSAGACSIFELGSPPKFGPPRHVHHREDEWYYVLAGDFIFEVGGEQHPLPAAAVFGYHAILLIAGRMPVQRTAKLFSCVNQVDLRNFLTKPLKGHRLPRRTPVICASCTLCTLSTEWSCSAPPLFSLTPHVTDRK